MKLTRMKLPRFKDEDQEREFWATHSALDYLDTSKPKKGSFPNLKPSIAASMWSRSCTPLARRRPCS
ncbi:MAG: hypothetical protein HYY32_05310, partial [Chloroflexi bacterium]|nr:hypothetical protein [Chloroflexota bacterium]